MLVLDNPVLQDSDNDEIKYCHMYCRTCGPPLAECGAYKPVPCGGDAVESIRLGFCDVCKKVPCTDCIESFDWPCRRCGN